MPSEDPTERIRWAQVLQAGFGRSFWLFVTFAVVMATLCFLVLGPDAFQNALIRDGELLGGLLPRVLAAQVVAGFVWVLLPRDRMSAFLRRNQGRRALIIAAAAGAITPGGPASAFPFLAILAGMGADIGILVTYITSWALLGIQRIIVWDMPFMGVDFSLLRFLIGAPLPILAGLVARRLPFTVSFEESAPPGTDK